MGLGRSVTGDDRITRYLGPRPDWGSVFVPWILGSSYPCSAQHAIPHTAARNTAYQRDPGIGISGTLRGASSFSAILSSSTSSWGFEGQGYLVESRTRSRYYMRFLDYLA